MVSEKKRENVKKLEEEIKEYPVIGLLDMFKLPAKQLQEIRGKLRGKAEIEMFRKSIIRRAIENAAKKGVKELETKIQNQPALLFSKTDPFELARIIESSKSFAAAKEGDVAPRDIIVKAGKTNLKAGPVIGELQRAKIPAGVEGENIIIKEDAVVVRKGETIDKNVADVLMKLGIEPMEISLNLLAVLDQGIVYPKELLFIPLEKYRDDVIRAHQNAFNLALNMGLPTKDTVPLLLSRAYGEALSLALEADVITKGTVDKLLSKAYSQMLALKEKIPSGTVSDAEEDTTEPDKEEKNENKENDDKVKNVKIEEG